MPSITITVSTEAHERLKKLKRPGQSFSDVILEHTYPPPCETAGEIIESLRSNPPPKADPKILKRLKKERGRRSRRSGWL
jgi:predicted CopG family antitoxin